MNRLDSEKKLLSDCVKFLIESEEFPRIEHAKDVAAHIGISNSELSSARNGYKEPIPYLNDILEFFQLDEQKGEFKSRQISKWTNIERLSRKLALNLIDVSMDSSESTNQYQQIIQSKHLLDWLHKTPQRPRERFILVTGAGASHAATNKQMLLAKDSVKHINKAIKSIKNPRIEQLIENEKKLQRFTNRAPDDNFEAILLAGSKYCKDIIIDSLKEICGNRYLPSYSYEILAHMIKHRLIDALINFNYDEILDNAIEDELPDKNYWYIYSDGDCPNSYDQMLVGKRLRQPVVIKPHGTISHISTLRFLGETRFTMVPEIRKTISDLIDSEIPNDAFEEDTWQERLPLNLIIIGFSMKSAEFNGIIRSYIEKILLDDKNSDREIHFWFFDIKQTIDDFELDFTEEELKYIASHSTFFDLNRTNLDDILETLWELTANKFNAPYKPRGIERHKLISKVLKPYQSVLVAGLNNELSLDQTENYYHDRFFLELMITFLQSDGMINTRQITEERPGKYFKLYKSDNNPVTLRDLLVKFGLDIHKGWVWDTYVLSDSEMFYKKDDLLKFVFKKLRDIYRKSNSKNKINISRQLLRIQSDFKNLGRLIRDRNLMKITPNFENPHYHVFPRLEDSGILNTSLRWIYAFRKMLENEKKWDLMLIISEKGRFLNQTIKNEDSLYINKKVELILASFDADSFSDLSYEQKTNLKRINHLTDKGPLFLPWWLHNQHMAFFVKKKNTNNKAKKSYSWKENWQLVEGYYYQSRLLSRRINPVRLTEEEDLQVLLDTFVNYWYRAKAYTETRQIPIIRERETLEKETDKLFDLF